MATTYTTNYNLGKQENHADKFDMDVITDNADKIDEALTAKADKSTTYTKTEVDTALSGKQATLTTAQLTAVNSGIDSAKVAQIETNKNNILTVADQSTQYNYSSVSSMSGTSGFTALYYFDRPIPTGTYRLICTNVRTDTSKQCQFQVVGANASEQYANLAPTISTANYVANEFTTTFGLYGIKVYCNTPIEITNLAIIPKALYDAGFKSYQPYALSNAELTTKEQVNENNISFVASQGRKNVLKFDSVGGGASSGITYTVNDDGTVRVSGTASALSYEYLRLNNSSFDAKEYTNGQFVLSGCPSGGGSNTYSLYASRGNYAKFDYGDGVILTPTSESEVSIVLRVEKGQTVDIVFKPMISLVGTDSTFEPYAMSNAELTAEIAKYVIAEKTLKLNPTGAGETPDVTMSQTGSADGWWISNGVSITGISRILSICITGFGSIREADVITPCTTNDKTQLRIATNTGTFKANATLTVQVFGLSS